MIQKFRKKPVVIEAKQLTDPLASDEIQRWIRGHGSFAFHSAGSYGTDLWMRLVTLEGVMQASKGDWVIRGVKGEFYPCRPDIFEATYEAVDV